MTTKQCGGTAINGFNFAKFFREVDAVYQDQTKYTYRLVKKDGNLLPLRLYTKQKLKELKGIEEIELP